MLELLEAQPRDLGDLGQGDLDLRLGVVAQALLTPGEDRRLGVLARADDEREAEALAIGGVERAPARGLLGRQALQARGGLLAGRRAGELAGLRLAPGQLGMGADELEPALARRR